MKSLQIAQLLRRTSMMQNQSCLLAARFGPKKKKGQVMDEKPLTDDICNIWKDRQDPKIFPTDSYPEYVRELISTQYTGDDIIMQLYRGERLPTGKE